jgi:hypothetical protein
MPSAGLKQEAFQAGEEDELSKVDQIYHTVFILHFLTWTNLSGPALINFIQSKLDNTKLLFP